MRPKLYKFIAISLGIILAAGAGEIILRVYKFSKYSTDTLRFVPASNLVYEHKPSIAFVNRHGIRITYNSLGFIGQEVGPKTNGVFRILGIGDSITAGEYLPEAKRYLNRTAAALSERTGRRMEVINAGVAGYNTWQELELLKVKGLAVEPDLIIVGVCLNDDCGWRPEFRKTWFGKMAPSPRHHKKAKHFDFLYQRSALYEFLYDELYRLKKMVKEGYKYFDEYNRYEVEGYTPDFKVWQRPLEDMILSARANNVKILFVIFPFEQQVRKGETESFKPLNDFFKREDACYLDLIKYLRTESKQMLFLKRDPIHLNVTGTGIAADVITNYIIEKNLLNK